MKLDVSGVEELMAEFSKMASGDLTTLERDAVRAGAEIVRRNQQALWNRSDAEGEHIQDAITIGRAYENKDGMGVNVGPKMSLRWRGKFVEYGTSRQPPQAPVEKSRSQSEGAATSAMMKVLERVTR